MYGVIVKINSFLWGNFLIILLVGTGIFYTFKLKFIQVRKFGTSLKMLTGRINLNGEKAGATGMSSFQALTTAVAAQVGTGNLAGAATALASGGPGAIFWMWISAFFGMATIYSEATLGQIYKTEINGKVTGGPAYYIEKSLKNKTISKFLACFFAVSCIVALGLMGNSVQANSIADAFHQALGVNPALIGVILAILGGFVFFGGIRRIASTTEKVVPIMAGLYIISCCIIIALNFRHIIPALSSIFIGAFDPRAIAGGMIGITVKKAIRYGVARGLFSNEAGMGSTPHAHAVARVSHPSEQGIIAIITVFIDTFVVLTATALVILTSGVKLVEGEGIRITQRAFTETLGRGGNIFIAICLLFFAFSTIIGWYFFGEANIKYLFKSEKAINIYRVLVMIMVVLGSLLKVDIAWELADMFNGLMVLPNLVGLLILSKIVKQSADDFEEKFK